MILKSAGELEKKTNRELVEIYNDVTTGVKVKKFSSHAIGVRRILEILAKMPSNSRPIEEVAEVVEVVRYRGPGRKTIDVPPGDAIKLRRKGSKLSRMVDMMLVGTTAADIARAFGWTPAMVSCTVGRFTRLTGYGVTRDAAGVLHAIPPK